MPTWRADGPRGTEKVMLMIPEKDQQTLRDLKGQPEKELE